MAKKNLCYLALSMIISSNFCYGMEYDKSKNIFNTKYGLHELVNNQNTIGSSFSSIIYKLDYQGKKYAIKFFSDLPRFEYEKSICEKIQGYSKKNKLSPNLMGALGTTKLFSSYSSEFTKPCKYNALVFEYIDGITLEQWKKNNKFKSVESFIDDFCIPSINAFKEYNKITDKYHEFLNHNIMMKQNKDKWIPVLIDYGKSNLHNYGPMYYLVNTLCSCLNNINDDSNPKLKYLSELLRKIENEWYLGSKYCEYSDYNIKSVDKLLEEIKKVRD